MYKRYRLGAASATALGLVLAAAAVRAQPAPSATGVDEVVVTAQRRASDLERTPLAITAVGAGALDRSFINEISGLNGLVPSLQITKASGFENLVTIRGVGSETPENAPTTTPGVSEFIDGVYIANTISLDQTLFDIDRIEVLRGPQGALYGQSSIGGAISIVTKQPELGRFGGTADLAVGDYSLTRERAEINLPLGQTAAVRASFQKYDHDGFTKDVAIPGFRLDDAHDVSGKVAVLWKPTDSFSATLTGQWYQSDQNGAAQKNILDPESSPRSLYQDYPGKFQLGSQLYHLNLQWDLPGFSIRSVTAYQGIDHVQQEDSSRSAISLTGAYDDVAGWNTKLANYNEELDLLSLPGSKLEWIAGVFALSQESKQFVAEFEGKGANPDVAITSTIETKPPSNLSYGNDTRVARQSYAGFVQGTYPILAALRLTVGARVNHDSYSLHSQNFSAFAVDTVSHAYTDTVPTGRVELDYDVTRRNLIYASVARGYKPGGANGTYGQVVIPAIFKPETNTALELGSKSEMFNRTLRLNLVAYYYFYRDMQYIENDPVPFDGGMANIPSVHEYGLEAEANYVAPDRRLRINASLAAENGQVQGVYKTIDSTVQNTVENNPSYSSPCAYGGAYYNPACWAAVIAGERNIEGKTPPAMPKISGSINLSYMFDVPTGTLTPRIEYIYRGSEWARIFNEAALDYVKAYGVTNLNFEYVPARSHFRASLVATNLFNAAGVNSRYTDPYGTGQTSQQYIAPRQVIGTVAYSF